MFKGIVVGSFTGGGIVVGAVVVGFDVVGVVGFVVGGDGRMMRGRHAF